MSTAKYESEEGIYFLGEPLKKEGPRTWYSAVELEPFDGSEHKDTFRVAIGDTVLVDAEEEEHQLIIRVTELFIDLDNAESPSRFKGRWFYRIEDTICMVTLDNGTRELPIDNNIGRRCDPAMDNWNDVWAVREGLEGRRVWLAEENDSNAYITENTLNCVVRITTVRHINPGDPIPKASECDFWYNQTHSRNFYTFKDLHKAPGVERSRQPLRRLHTLKGVDIRTTHAVDMDEDAVRTYRCNQPGTEVHHSSVEEFLYLCKHFDQLACKLEIPREKELSPSKRVRVEDSVEVMKILSMELRHSVKKVKDGQGEGQLERDLSMKNTWLVFTCQQKSGREIELRESDVRQNPKALRTFIMSHNLPRPGDIQVIVGGPPCQGVSGLNRHAQQTDVLSCHRNRLVKSFFRTIEFFRPEYALMENVQDIMRKEDGAYAKFATAQLLALGYQSRLGLIAAGSYGAAQVMEPSGAVADDWVSVQVALPSFPQPTFRMYGRSTLANNAKCCEVGFLTEEDRRVAHPGIRNGDVLSDLPEVSNFRLTDNASYKSAPERPIQAWLRRSPDENALDLEARANRADEMMRGSHSLIRELVDGKTDETRNKDDTPVRVAELVQCQLGEGRKNDFATEIREIYMKEIKSMPNCEELIQALDDKKRDMLGEHGREVLRALEELEKIPSSFSDLVRNHRPRLCNSDDYYRIQQVPKGPGKSFRDMPGVYVNGKGTVCAGHTHAFIGHGCPGGGTTKLPKRSVYKESRIDHADKQGWRGMELEGCPARTEFTPTLNLVCTRWCITYKNGRASGRHVCFGRLRLDDVQPTVVTRAEPHNLEIVHPYQDRVLSIREMARCQGFPDYYVFVGTERKGTKKRSLARLRMTEDCYRQIGNAVSPPVAAALGRCLALAAGGHFTPNDPIIRTEDEDMNETLREAIEKGLKFYAEEPESRPTGTGLSVSESKDAAEEGSEGEENEVEPATPLDDEEDFLDVFS